MANWCLLYWQGAFVLHPTLDFIKLLHFVPFLRRYRIILFDDVMLYKFLIILTRKIKIYANLNLV
jgi:hypothetical protein